jgi:hypothetical protein
VTSGGDHEDALAFLVRQRHAVGRQQAREVGQQTPWHDDRAVTRDLARNPGT